MNEFLEISRAVSNIAANPWAAVLLIVLVILWLFISFQRSKREKRESEVKHRHAPNLMDELDRYVAYCVRVAYDDGRGIDVSESPPPIYSEDINWEAMDSKIHYRVRSLLNASKEIAASFDSSSVEIKSPDCEKYFEEKQLAYARLGLEACDIAKQARGIYGIPRPGILKGERPEIALKRKVGEIEGSRRRKTTKERLEKSVHRLRSFLSRR
ncbi:MAG: hypothetical protein OXF24_02185 [Hyphomicrobiales bacterium]|nr:hypothetical protein [Hyphomicrobiales bacterium]